MALHNRISSIELNVADPEKLALFYCDVLGMTRQGHQNDVAVGYQGQGASLILRPVGDGPAYIPQKTDRYWKIAITLPNLNLAHAQLVKAGVQATEPHQFRDIAYMSHLSDPEGHVIELIQHSFEGQPRTADGDPRLSLGGGAQIGLVTLRTTDIAAETRYFVEELGMSYLSRQEVSQLGFDLYFFAPTDDVRPNPDVNSVENREWLWRRPYTVLEFQHLLNDGKVVVVDKQSLGSATVTIDHSDSSKTEFN